LCAVFNFFFFPYDDKFGVRPRSVNKYWLSISQWSQDDGDTAVLSVQMADSWRDLPQTAAPVWR